MDTSRDEAMEESGMSACDVDVNSESSSDSDDGDDEATSKQISSIEETLSQNPYHYQSHIDLIKLLRNFGELEKLRDARTRMAKLFPLTQTLWMEWIEDEKKFAESEDEHDYIVKLFELAVKDYMCPEVWLEYSQYSIRWMSKPDGLKLIRDVMERALAAVGQHVTEGASLWEMSREFENAMLLNIQPQPGSVVTPEQQDKIKKQMDMEKTYQEYVTWCEGDIDSSIKHTYEQCLKKLKDLKPLEDALLTAEPPMLQEFLNYIDHETKSGIPSRVECIYERALVRNCLNSELWSQYLTYMNQQSYPPEILVGLNLRSVRNCPWIGRLWVQYLEALERTNASSEKMSEAFEEALKAGFSTSYEYVELWLTRCAQMRRMVANGNCTKEELSKCFEDATKYVTETLIPAYNDSGDPDYSLWTLWANCEAGVNGNVTKAEDILKSLTQSDPNARRKLQVWREYCSIIRLFGGEDRLDKCRLILRQAVQQCAILPDPTVGGVPDAEVACQMLIDFERQYGTIKDMDESMKRVNNKLSRMAQRRAKDASSYDEQKDQKKSKQKHQKKSKQMQNKRKFPEEKSKTANADSKPAKQRKIADEPSTSSSNQGFKAPEGLPVRYVKKSVRQAVQSSEVQQGSASDPPPKSKVAPPPGFKGPPPGFKPDASSTADKNNNKNVEVAEDSKVAHVESTLEEGSIADKRSIFISNLDYKLDDVEEKLKTVFCSCGNITEVRLVKNNKGQFRGFCYIQFSDENAVQKALELDRTNLEGRPMFVSPNVDKRKQPNFKVFKYDVGLEKHKLFVSNISFHTTEDTLKREFSKHGSLKGIRVVTNRRGQSKGLAYVEYEKETDAAQAVMKMDGSKIDDFAIKVAISNPPSRKPTQDDQKSQPAKRDQFKGSRGRGRTQLSMMVPRSIQRSNQPQKSDGNSSSASSGGMTNKDFANMLLKK